MHHGQWPSFRQELLSGPLRLASALSTSLRPLRCLQALTNQRSGRIKMTNTIYHLSNIHLYFYEQIVSMCLTTMHFVHYMQILKPFHDAIFLQIAFDTKLTFNCKRVLISFYPIPIHFFLKTFLNALFL